MMAITTIPTLIKSNVVRICILNRKNSLRPAKTSISCTRQSLTTKDTIEDRKTDQADEVDETEYNNPVVPTTAVRIQLTVEEKTRTQRNTAI